MSEKASEFELFFPKADAAWNAIQNQYGNRITVAESDHLFARLVLGLTSPFYTGRDPVLHFKACHALVGRRLSPERVHAALHAVPKASEPWVARAFELAEEHGTKIGTTLAEQRDRSDLTEAGADAAHRELSSVAKEQVG